VHVRFATGGATAQEPPAGPPVGPGKPEENEDPAERLPAARRVTRSHPPSIYGRFCPAGRLSTPAGQGYAEPLRVTSVPKRPGAPSRSKEGAPAGARRTVPGRGEKGNESSGSGHGYLRGALRRRVGGRRLLRLWLAVRVRPDRMGSAPLRQPSGAARGYRLLQRAVGPGLPVRPARVDLPGVLESRLARCWTLRTPSRKRRSGTT
jgi:hypothetical protein